MFGCLGSVIKRNLVPLPSTREGVRETDRQTDRQTEGERERKRERERCVAGIRGSLKTLETESIGFEDFDA